MSFVKISMKLKKDTRYYSTRTPDLLSQVRVFISVYKTYVLRFNLSTYVHQKIIIDIQCVQIKWISRLFAKNLNDFNIHLSGQTVYYSVSPFLNVPFGEEPPQFHVVPHFCYISDI